MTAAPGTGIGDEDGGIAGGATAAAGVADREASISASEVLQSGVRLAALRERFESWLPAYMAGEMPATV